MSTQAASRPPDFRLVDVTLDSNSIVTRSVEIEIERHKAISDILADSRFGLVGAEKAQGPYRLHLSLAADRLHMQVNCAATNETARIELSMAPLRRHLSDYVI